MRTFISPKNDFFQQFPWVVDEVFINKKARKGRLISSIWAVKKTCALISSCCNKAFQPFVETNQIRQKSQYYTITFLETYGGNVCNFNYMNALRKMAKSILHNILFREPKDKLHSLSIVFYSASAFISTDLNSKYLTFNLRKKSYPLKPHPGILNSKFLSNVSIRIKFRPGVANVMVCRSSSSELRVLLPQLLNNFVVLPPTAATS